VISAPKPFDLSNSNRYPSIHQFLFCVALISATAQNTEIYQYVNFSMGSQVSKSLGKSEIQDSQSMCIMPPNSF